MWRVVRLSEDLVSNAADKSAILRSLRCDNQEGLIDLKTPFVDLYTKYLWVSEFLKSRPVYVGCHRLNRYINQNGRWSKLKRRHWCRLSFTVTCPLTCGSCKAGTTEVRIMCTDPWRGRTCEGGKELPGELLVQTLYCTWSARPRGRDKTSEEEVCSGFLTSLFNTEKDVWNVH